MAFLERFKGRTSHLTKEGVVCNLTNASTPIIKHLENTQSQQYFSPHKGTQRHFLPFITLS